MRRQNRDEKAVCERVSGIWCEETAGKRPTEQELRFIADHVKTCASCSKLSHVAMCLKDGEADSMASDPILATDELSTRRLAEESLKKFRQSRSSSESERRPRILARLSVAAVLFLGLAAFFYGNRQDATPFSTGEPRDFASTTPKQEPRNGTFLLFSRNVSKNGKKTFCGDTIGTEDHIATHRGQGVIELSPGIRVFLDKQTLVVVQRLDREEARLFLERGDILIEADPTRRKSRLAVDTRAGMISVTGTVLSVSAAPPLHHRVKTEHARESDRVKVQVMRGSIQVVLAQDPGATQTVRAGQVLDLGRGELGRMTEQDRTLTKRRLEKLNICHSDSCAELVVSSVPSGAKVVLDDREIGETPLAARISKGTYTLWVAHENHGSVKEIMEINDSREVRRVFELNDSELRDGGGGKKLMMPSTPSSVAEGPKVSKKSAKHKNPVRPMDEILQDVQNARRYRQWERVAALYRAILGAYPDAHQAQSSKVSLGYVELEHLGNAEQALRAFEMYLECCQNGSLVQEAEFGKALALRALGRVTEERLVLRDFLNRFPTAIQAKRARARYRQLLVDESFEQ